MFDYEITVTFECRLGEWATFENEDVPQIHWFVACGTEFGSGPYLYEVRQGHFQG